MFIGFPGRSMSKNKELVTTVTLLVSMLISVYFSLLADTPCLQPAVYRRSGSETGGTARG